MLVEHIGSKDKTLVWLENSSHMLPVDGERDIVFEEVGRFIKRIIYK